MMMCGKPDSGKSHLVYELLNNPEMYNKKFNKVIIVSPSHNLGGYDLRQHNGYSEVFDTNWI